MKPLMMAMALCASLAFSSAQAQVGRRGGQARANVSNRTTGANRNLNNSANVNRNGNVNRNANINQNVNVNRNVNVNTSYRGGCCYDHDDGWNWGSFAVGAAAGAVTGAAVSAATQPSTTVVATTPAVGSVVPALPGGCATIHSGDAVIYHCNSIYYRPYYQGTTLVYRVVTYP